MKQVALMRVQRSETGALPNGYAEGTIVGFTFEEIETLKKNPILLKCFEYVQISHPEFLHASPKPSPSPETPATTDQSSLSATEPALDRKT